MKCKFLLPLGIHSGSQTKISGLKQAMRFTSQIFSKFEAQFRWLSPVSMSGPLSGPPRQ